MGIWMLLLQMMLTDESNEPLKGGWEPNAEDSFPSKEKSAVCSLTIRGLRFSDSPS